ncbi:MAG: S9 family peptidase [Nitriliruptor sp.]|uniref:S9 family peptidase n=1 Tax=Nitriliruptor sp. TaxID=2448056 RepID=UPI0034A09958
MTADAAPPFAERRPHTLERPGGAVDDPYHWLRDREDLAVTSYLEAENAHAEAHLGPLEGLIGTIFEEIKGRIEEDDTSAPSFREGWAYYRRTLEGKQYPVHCRRPVPDEHVGADLADLPLDLRRPVDPASPPADEVVLLDENVEAEGHDQFSLGGLHVSPSGRFAAWLVDTSGAEVFEVRIRDLETGEDTGEIVPRAGYGLAWYADDAAFLYTITDDAWRPHQVWRHTLGTDASEDVLVHAEPDERFWLGVGRTRSREHLIIAAGSKITSECRLLPADDPDAAPLLVAERETGVEYDVDHDRARDRLVITTNADGAEDFAVVTAGVPTVDDPDAGARDRWQPLIAHRPGVRVEGVACFAEHLVVGERTEARTQVRICDPITGEGDPLAVDEEVSSVGMGPNPEYGSHTLRYVYGSMTTPVQIVDVALDAQRPRVETKELIKQQRVRGGYDRERYVSWRDWATASDGTRVPISLVRRADTPLDGSAPCLLYGYGAYEISLDPGFSPARLSLLDRGAVFAIAHVRGGGEMGRRWYEDGKFARKPNSFSDFVACADHLVAEGITARDRLAIRGGSAGGLLIGAALNLEPGVAAVAVAEVPFVDVVTTMSDPTIPLTVIEYDEWGDPTLDEFAGVMASYSPYDNVRAEPYPAMLVTAGLNDPRVQYWEPAKWVAKLRATTTGGGPYLLKTQMGAGHAGRSGRYDAWRDEAEVLAFVLTRTGAVPAP